MSRAGNLTPKALVNGISIYRSKEYFDFDKAFTGEEPLGKFDSNKLVDDNFEEVDEELIANDKIRVAWQNEKITLMPGDSIIVKEATNTINIYGEVYNPG